MNRSGREADAKLKLRLWAALGVLLALLIAIIVVVIQQNGDVVLRMQGDQTLTVEYGEEYVDPGVQAVYDRFLGGGEKPLDISVDGSVNTEALGEYQLTYTAVYQGQTRSATRTVRVVDTTKPEIILTTTPGKYTQFGQPYQEEGFTAVDRCDGDLTAKVERVEEGNKVIYTVTDASGNTAIAERRIIYYDGISPVLTLKGSGQMTIMTNSAYTEPGYTATDNIDGDLTAEVRVDGTVNTAKAGTYVIRYTVSDTYGNTVSLERTVVVETDTAKPVITLKGSKYMTLSLTEKYTEPGCTASDNADGDLTAKVQISGTVNTAKAGTYTVTYTVQDQAGNKASAVRTIVVEGDKTIPIIILKGDKTITLSVGDTFTDPGYSAKDNLDGDLTDKVTVTGTVNTAVAGTYTVRYAVKDSAGNAAGATRTVVVQQSSSTSSTKPSEPVTPAKKVIYLTFDDGPGRYTEQLLGILKKYNAKATFFVVETNNTKYLPLLKNMVEDGHAVAVHSATHNFNQIYASEEAYFNDLNRMRQLIYDHSGVWTNLIRFPGGSSNTASKFNPGIMTRLTQAVEQKGYVYFDWNVDSNDAGGAKTASEVANNVINGCKKRTSSVVLMHDIKKYTVEGIEQVLQWGAANGYSFEALTKDSPTAHHRINN